MKLTTGQPFVDQDGALCIYLGFTAAHPHENIVGRVQINKESGSVTQTEYKPAEIYMCFYKNTWISCIVDKEFKAFELNEKAKKLIETLSTTYTNKHDWYCGE